MGLGVAEFWAMTPREVAMAAQAANRRARSEHRRDAWLAWHVGALARVKRLPPLKQLMGEMQTKALTPEEAERRKREHEEMVAMVSTSPRALSPRKMMRAERVAGEHGKE